jgi:hypothetical protein
MGPGHENRSIDMTIEQLTSLADPGDTVRSRLSLRLPPDLQDDRLADILEAVLDVLGDDPSLDGLELWVGSVRAGTLRRRDLGEALLADRPMGLSDADRAVLVGNSRPRPVTLRCPVPGCTRIAITLPDLYDEPVRCDRHGAQMAK